MEVATHHLSAASAKCELVVVVSARHAQDPRTDREIENVDLDEAVACTGTVVVSAGMHPPVAGLEQALWPVPALQPQPPPDSSSCVPRMVDLKPREDPQKELQASLALHPTSWRPPAYPGYSQVHGIVRNQCVKAWALAGCIVPVLEPLSKVAVVGRSEPVPQ